MLSYHCWCWMTRISSIVLSISDIYYYCCDPGFLLYCLKGWVWAWWNSLWEKLLIDIQGLKFLLHIYVIGYVLNMMICCSVELGFVLVCEPFTCWSDWLTGVDEVATNILCLWIIELLICCWMIEFIRSQKLWLGFMLCSFVDDNGIDVFLIK